MPSEKTTCDVDHAKWLKEQFIGPLVADIEKSIEEVSANELDSESAEFIRGMAWIGFMYAAIELMLKPSGRDEATTRDIFNKVIGLLNEELAKTA